MMNVEQVPSGTPPRSARSSQRYGGVWSDHRQHQTPPAGMKDGSDVTPTAGPSAYRAKRSEAAEWIRSLTGVCIPYGQDLDFRIALRDGELLCNIMNVVCPGSIPKIWQHAGFNRSELAQRFEAVQSFLSALATLGVPALCTFSCTDLESPSHEDLTRVADCILWLKRLYQEVSPVAPMTPYSPALHPPHVEEADDDDVEIGARDSPRSDVKKKMISFGSPILPTAGAAASFKGAAAAAAGGFEFRSMCTDQNLVQEARQANGVSQLIQHCSAMLHEHRSASSDLTTTTTTTYKSMSVSNSSLRSSSSTGDAVGEFNFDAVGPVLESVLGNLTQEYERRLLMKDQEIISTKEKMSSLGRQMSELQTQITIMREELAAQQEEAEASAVVCHSNEVRALGAMLSHLHEKLEEREVQFQALGLMKAGDGAAAECSRLSAEVDRLAEHLSCVHHLEEQYRAVQEENRRLYNLVQDLKGSIRVFCRVRPLGATGDVSTSCLYVDAEGEELAIYGLEPGKNARKLFKFDRIFDQGSSQEEVYSDAQQLIRSVLDGYNVCIFAYGQTGAGKTHTMSGTYVHDISDRGINYRALDDLFALREKRSGEIEYTIRVQMLEIYNETLRDLLSEDQSSGGNRLDILNTQASGCNVPNAVQMEVCCPQDVLDMMGRGACNRHSAETRMNDRSSRSHQILTVIVDGFNKQTHARSHGCLHLVDLAGSERVSKSEASGDRLTEAQYINKSLSALGDVMSALASRDKHIPFRNSKLTQLLADSLSGQAKVMMFMHAAPEANSYLETLSTLKFATRVSEVTLGQAKKNVECSKAIMAEEEVMRLREEVVSTQQRLEDEQRLKDALRLEAEALRAQLEIAAHRNATATSPDADMNIREEDSASKKGPRQTSAHVHCSSAPVPLIATFLNLTLEEAPAMHAPHHETSICTPRSAANKYSGNYGPKRTSSTTPLAAAAPSASKAAAAATAALDPTPKPLTSRVSGSFTSRVSGSFTSRVDRPTLVAPRSTAAAAAAAHDPAPKPVTPLSGSLTSRVDKFAHVSLRSTPTHGTLTPPSSSARPCSTYAGGSSLVRRPSLLPSPSPSPISQSMRTNGVHASSLSASKQPRAICTTTPSSGYTAAPSSSHAVAPSSGYAVAPSSGYAAKHGGGAADLVPPSAGGRRSMGSSWNR